MKLVTQLLGIICIGGAAYTGYFHPEPISKFLEWGTSLKNEITAPNAKESLSEESSSNKKKMELPGKLKGIPERIISHTGYTLSFNREHNTPNWVAWELTNKETMGSLPRADFLPDPDIPLPHRVTPDDYKKSGYDRGHMVPAADMKWDRQAMKECFYMSNMCPQDGSLNSGPWSKLENACRRWASQEGSIYIICGPVYKGKKTKKIGKEHLISVPDGFFKAVLSLQKGKEKAIAFYYNNGKGKQNMEKAAMSVDQMEKLTGMNFFIHLPDKMEKRLEATYDLRAWK